MKVFLYERVSSEEQVRHGYSLDAQHEALTRFCKENNHVILGVYKDEGISARKPYTKRPAMLSLLADMKRVKPDIILFTKLDRWFRNIKEYYKVQELLDQCKVNWKAVNEEYDTSTASGRLYVNIKLSIAQDEADRTSERIKDIQGQLVAQGKVLGGTVPFGYAIKNKRVVFGPNIHIVKEAIDYYLLHQSAHATTRHINALYGTNFTNTHIVRLFRSTLLKGQYRTNTAYCEPLIDPATWDKLQKIIDNNIKHTSNYRAYLFTGLLKCPVCGRRLGGCYDGSRKYYRCPAKYNGYCIAKHNANEKKIEAWLLENIEQDFKLHVKIKDKAKKENPKKYIDRLKRLNDIYLLGNIDEAEYKKQSADLQQKIADLQKQEPIKTQTLTAGWRKVYQMLDDEHKRSFWRGLISEVVLDADFKPKKIMY